MKATATVNLSQRTADRLREHILKEKKGFRQGDKLPNENELSSALGVSRTTLREAIRILVNEGLLTVLRGKGTFVAQGLERYASGSSLSGTDVRDMKITLRDLFEARMIIEPKACALAVRRADDAEIEEILHLGEIVQKNIKQNPRGSARIESEIAFHGALLRASHNDFIEQFIPLLTQTIEKTFALDENLEMDSLRYRDAEAIESAVFIHLRHAAWHEDLTMA